MKVSDRKFPRSIVISLFLHFILFVGGCFAMRVCSDVVQRESEVVFFEEDYLSKEKEEYSVEFCDVYDNPKSDFSGITGVINDAKKGLSKRYSKYSKAPEIDFKITAHEPDEARFVFAMNDLESLLEKYWMIRISVPMKYYLLLKVIVESDVMNVSVYDEQAEIQGDVAAQLMSRAFIGVKKVCGVMQYQPLDKQVFFIEFSVDGCKRSVKVYNSAVEAYKAKKL